MIIRSGLSLWKLLDPAPEVIRWIREGKGSKIVQNDSETHGIRSSGSNQRSDKMALPPTGHLAAAIVRRVLNKTCVVTTEPE